MTDVATPAPAASTTTAAPAAAAPAATPTTATPAAPTTLLGGDPAAAAAVEYNIKLPENSILDPASVPKLVEFAKEIGLKPEGAQKLAERDSAMLEAVAEHVENARIEEWGEKVKGWEDAVKADPEIGGAKLPETVALADKALRQFTSPEFRQMLNATGFGNHPEVVKLFAKIGKAISEDNFTTKGDPQPAGADTAKVFYPSMN